MPQLDTMGYYSQFPKAIPLLKVGYVRVTHPCATNSYSEKHKPVRLACIRPAASVHPEPGSNSPLYDLYNHIPMGFVIISSWFKKIIYSIPSFNLFSDFSYLAANTEFHSVLTLFFSYTFFISLSWYVLLVFPVYQRTSSPPKDHSPTTTHNPFPRKADAKIHTFSLPQNIFTLFFEKYFWAVTICLLSIFCTGIIFWFSFNFFKKRNFWPVAYTLSCVFFVFSILLYVNHPPICFSRNRCVKDSSGTTDKGGKYSG